jgi:uncharacterized protein
MDTGVLVSAAWTNDPDHTRCVNLLAQARELRVIPAPVLVEVDHFLSSNSAWMALLGDVTAGNFIVEDLQLGDYVRVAELMTLYRDLKVGFVDCAVLAVIERLAEPKLATLDRRHFSVMRPAHRDTIELIPELA